MSFLQVSECLSCQHGISFETLLPHLAAVIVEEAEVSGDCVWLRARARSDDAACPRCGCCSASVHSICQRRLSDDAIGRAPGPDQAAGTPVLCVNPECRVRTFAEQVSGLTSIALALVGRAGARMAGALGLTAGRSACCAWSWRCPTLKRAP